MGHEPTMPLRGSSGHDGRCPREADGPSVWPLLIGLELVLFTCFVALIAFTTRETALPAKEPSGMANAIDGQGVALPVRDAVVALTVLSKDVAAALGIPPVQVGDGSDELRIRLPADQLFDDGEGPRPSLRTLFERIAETAGELPDDLRLEISFTLGVSGALSPEDAESFPSRRRAVGFARAADSVPGVASRVAVGIAPGQPETAVLAFRLVPLRGGQPSPTGVSR